MKAPTRKRAKQIRDALHRMPTEALCSGVAAFSHPPRNQSRPDLHDAHGCFIYEAYHVFFDQVADGNILSCGYECYNGWFKGECLRELAERGAAAETSLSHHTDTKEPELCHSSP